MVKTRTIGIVTTVLVLGAAAWTFWAMPSSSKRPNILLVVSDDQRFDTLDYIPIIQNEIFRRGVHFKNSYVTTPQCCPSRASILTGQYASKHGVRGNRLPLKKPTVANYLHDAGYKTALIGKYLNSWRGEKRNEYDYWVSFHKGSAEYENPRLNVQGVWKKESGYITTVLKNYALQFIKESAEGDKPFFLIFTPNAPHEPATPAEEDKHLYQGLPDFRPPSYMEADMSDKPDWLKRRSPFSSRRVRKLDAFRLRQLRTLASLDRAVGEIMRELEALNILDKTAVFFISDNGVLWGEHRLKSKDCVYQEAVRVPFALRFKGLPGNGSERSELAANIDIAPTIYDLAGVAPAPNMDGLSLAGLLNGKTKKWRDALLIEDWRTKKHHRPFAAIHTGRYVYSRSGSQSTELYDLQTDPYQLDSLAGKPEHAAIEEKMRAELSDLLRKVRVKH